MKEAALSINRNFKTFWNAVENKLKCSDYFWTKVKYDKLDLSKMHNYEDTRKCPVFQYDNLGNYESSKIADVNMYLDKRTKKIKR